MKLVAQKPCSFGGKKYFIGNEVPVDEVLNPKMHVAMGTLAILEEEAEAQQADAKITVRVGHGENEVYINVTPEGLQAVVDVLSASAKDAEPIIEQMTDGDALILLHASDSRKAIKEAAKERVQAITEESEGEQ